MLMEYTAIVLFVFYLAQLFRNRMWLGLCFHLSRLSSSSPSHRCSLWIHTAPTLITLTLIIIITLTLIIIITLVILPTPLALRFFSIIDLSGDLPNRCHSR